MNIQLHPEEITVHLGDYYATMTRTLLHALKLPLEEFKQQVDRWDSFLESFLLYAPRWYDPIWDQVEDGLSSYYTLCCLVVLVLHRMVYDISNLSKNGKQLSLMQWLDSVTLFGRIQPTIMKELLTKITNDPYEDSSKWIDFSVSMVDKLHHRLEKSASGKRHGSTSQDILEMTHYLLDSLMLWSEVGNVWPEVYVFETMHGVSQRVFLIHDEILPILDAMINEIVEDDPCENYQKMKVDIQQCCYHLLIEMMRYVCFAFVEQGRLPESSHRLINMQFQTLWQSLMEKRELHGESCIVLLCQQYDIAALWLDYKTSHIGDLPMDETQLNYILDILQTYTPANKTLKNRRNSKTSMQMLQESVGEHDEIPEVCHQGRVYQSFFFLIFFRK
jgi:hypothetical protein